MSILKTISHEEAEGQISMVYSSLKEFFGKVPNVLEMFSTNPRWLMRQAEYLKYYSEHPKLGMAFWAYIRLLVSCHFEGEYCIRLNTLMLKKLGVPDESIESAIKNPENTELPENEKVLLLLSLKAIKAPWDISEENMDEARKIGWTDEDIFDAIFHATNHSGSVKLIEAMKIENDF